MSIIDDMTEERFFQLLRDIRALSDESFEHLLSDLKRTGKLPKKHHDDEPRQLQLVLMIDQTLADNTDNKHQNN